MTDKLTWGEKTPLALALIAQSYVVFNWYRGTTHGIDPVVDFVIALAAGVALDWLVVSTIMGRREGRESIWSWLTSFGAFAASALISLDTYSGNWTMFDLRAMLHMAFPLVVLLYSQHLATAKRAPVEMEQAAPMLSLALPDQVNYPPPMPVGPKATQASSETTEASRYHCPTCGTPLSMGQYGAAKRHGHCASCK